MRLIKAQNTNLRSITGKGVQYGIDDLVTVDSANSMIVPKGADADMPATPVNGMIRYNTDDDQFEGYQNGAWREFRFKEPNQDPGIVWQNLGVGDITGTETVFGELNSGDADYPVPDAAENILVLVENVIQIPTTNYTIEQTATVNVSGANPGSYVETDTGWWILFTSGVPTGKPVTVIHNLDK